jgi:hypothetical protein
MIFPERGAILLWKTFYKENSNTAASTEQSDFYFSLQGHMTFN